MDFERLNLNFTGTVRRETLNGREHLVAPLTMIVPGVLKGSRGALYYSSEEIGRNVKAWNGMPITVDHPTHNGQPVSARRPEILNKQGVGTVFSAEADGKLTAEGWFDVERTKAVDERVLNALETGQPFELSTGLYLDTEPAPDGATYNGEAYQFLAKNYQPDHLAVFVDKTGACSLQDGCGVNVNESLIHRIARYFGLTGNQISHDDLRMKLHGLIKAQSSEEDCWIVDVFDKEVVYQSGPKLYKVGYVTDLRTNQVALAPGLPVEVSRSTTYKPATNEDKDMATKSLVDHLIANCDCWDESDRETLNKLSDAKLEKLKAKADKSAEAQAVIDAANEGYQTLHGKELAVNAMPEFIKKAIAKKKAKEDDEEDEDVEDNKKKKATANESRLTAEEQEDLAFARNEKNRQKQDLISQLTANVSAADRPKVLNRLKDKSLDELRDLALLAPAQEEPVYQPTYYGAAVPAMNSATDKDDILPQPDYGWDG